MHKQWHCQLLFVSEDVFHGYLQTVERFTTASYCHTGVCPRPTWWLFSMSNSFRIKFFAIRLQLFCSKSDQDDTVLFKFHGFLLCVIMIFKSHRLGCYIDRPINDFQQWPQIKRNHMLVTCLCCLQGLFRTGRTLSIQVLKIGHFETALLFYS